jgi:hypothetical protein
MHESTVPAHPIGLNDADRQWVEHVLACRWVTPAGVTAAIPSLVGQSDIAIGSYKTTLEAVVAARPNSAGGVALEFCPTHDGWKILPLKLYRPLVCYAAFGSDDVFGCMRAALVSLLTFGRWSHSIAILTRSEDLAKVTAVVADLHLEDRLHIVTVPGADILDWCLARYRTDVADVFATHQPILYLDVDVICDGPLDDLCVKLVHTRTIEVLPEGSLDEGAPSSFGHWFGWRLMAADGIIFDPVERVVFHQAFLVSPTGEWWNKRSARCCAPLIVMRRTSAIDTTSQGTINHLPVMS